MLVEKKSTIASLELDGYTLKCEGILGEMDWEFTMSFKDGFIPFKVWTEKEFCIDEEDVEALMWSTFLRLTRKYSVVVFDEGVLEVDEYIEEESNA